MVRHHASRGIGVEVQLAQTWRVPIDHQTLLARGHDLRQNLFIALQDARHVHHLRQAQDAFVFQQG